MRPSGGTSRRCSRTRRRWPPGSRSWPGQSEAKDGGRAAVQRWEAQLQRLGREEQRLVDAYQAEVIDLAELKARREQVRGRRQVLVDPARPGAAAARRAAGGEGGLVGPRGVLPAGAVPPRRGDARGDASGSCSC